ncbi:MAG: hypothetical protein KAI66_17720 [Lentisphaeria bacterium]|nr:hypothetical protein [Lentisphaeria bacterium]
MNNLTRKERSSAFTLLEILVVLAIIILATALVAPSIGRMPGRLTVEQALSSIRTAMSESALVARAGGTPMRLTLNMEDNSFSLAAFTPEKGFAADTVPHPQKKDAPHPEKQAPGLVTSSSLFKLSKEIKWDDEIDATMNDAPEFLFFPDGEATGPVLQFMVARQHFKLSVDRLTGACAIRDGDW